MDTPKPPIELIFPPSGGVRHIYSEDAAKITADLGHQEVRRASHVEPTEELSDAACEWLWAHSAVVLPSKWWADMLPVGGPVLGHFATRQEALDAETAWLREHNIPVCPDGNCSR